MFTTKLEKVDESLKNVIRDFCSQFFSNPDNYEFSNMHIVEMFETRISGIDIEQVIIDWSCSDDAFQAAERAAKIKGCSVDELYS